jgi:formylglycine-generating enzyme required for sulfatase activity
VEVILPQSEMREIQSGKAGERPRGPERRREIQESVQEADIAVICLSTQFHEFAPLNREWEVVFEEVVKKQQAGDFLVPVRLEECILPQSLENHPPIDLFEIGGFEKLLLAVNIHTDKVKANLPQSDIRTTDFTVAVPQVEMKESEERRSYSPWTIAAIVSGILALIFAVRFVSSASVQTKLVPVEKLAERATQNIQLEATNRASTVTADVFSIIAPLTQTAVYLTTSMPLTQTSVEFEARITPTLTLTSTPTLTPSPTLTVVSLPMQIMTEGNISMVLVPGGSFLMGNDEDDNASPSGSIYLDSFYIDQFEVTTLYYQRCVQSGVCQPPSSNSSQTQIDYFGTTIYSEFPVVNVDWNMARIFCEWRGMRLPTEAEWEKAARGPDDLYYPWGDEAAQCSLANFSPEEGSCIGDTQPAGKYQAGVSIYNTYNMAGNVAEWVGSLYYPYPYDVTNNQDDTTIDGFRVVRGGSWASPSLELLTYHRVAMDPSTISLHGNDLGFRCVRPAGP